MIRYRKILELHDEGISLRGIAASTGNSRQKVTEIIGLAKKKGLVCPLEEEMTDKWIEEFLFPENIPPGRFPWFFQSRPVLSMLLRSTYGKRLRFLLFGVATDV